MYMLASCMHSHMFSIHSPQRMRNTTRKEWKKSPMCQRREHEVSGSQDFMLLFSEPNLEPNSCMPTTEKIKTTMARTIVRFPRAPTEWPIILISVFKVGQDLANLKTLSCRNRQWTKTEEKPVKDKFYLFSHKTNGILPIKAISILKVVTNSISLSTYYLPAPTFCFKNEIILC